jgi:RNA polymerase sigma factor (sigma-70 family)
MEAVARALPLAETLEDPCGSAAADDVLARRAQAGDAVALDALTQRYRAWIHAFALGILLRREDAEDVTQETFIRMCRGIEGYRSRGQFRAWLFRIAANLCRDHRRAYRRSGAERVSQGLEDVVATAAGPEQEVATRTTLLTALDRLPEQYREVLVLHCLEEFTPAEIAHIVGRPRAAVRMQLWRARARLAKELGDWLE